MDNLKPCSLFLFLSFFISISAAQPLPVDTIRLDEVIVTGSMPRVHPSEIPLSLSIIGEQQIQQRLQPSLLPLLSEEVPGLFITGRGVMGYGVAAGAAGGISIRGIGGTPTSGVLVLIDGQPQYMGLMGHPLADSYQSLMAERVEVIRGPASVLYGSNAMGGVINIITKQPKNDGLTTSAQMMGGSHQTFSAEASAGWKKERVHLSANIGYNRSDGHRKNMEFEQWIGHLKTNYRISPNWSGSAQLNLSRTQSSNPGSEENLLNDNDADVTRGLASIALHNQYERSSGAIRLYHNFGMHKINDGYGEGEAPPLHRFHSTDYMMGVSIHQSHSFLPGNNVTVGVDLHRFGGRAQNRSLEGASIETLTDTAFNSAAVFVNARQSIWGKRILLNGGIRLEHHPVNGMEWIPQVGAIFTPTPSTHLKALVSKGFRNPTLRELYLFPPRNPLLTAERLINYEISFLQQWMDRRLKMELTFFYIKGENMIQVAFIEGRPLNVNTGLIDNKGIEFSGSYQFARQWQLSANYSLLTMAHSVLSAPEHKLHVAGNFQAGRWSASSGIQHIRGLYTRLLPQPVKESYLHLHARGGYRASERLQLFVRGENLLNQSYQINDGYPMPGITFFAGIAYYPHLH